MTDETPKKKTTKKAADESSEAPKKPAAKKAAADAPKKPAAKKVTSEATAAKNDVKKTASPEKAEKKATPAPKKAAKPAKKAKAVSREHTLLSDLKPAEGAKKLKNRVGRGRASGSGKTCNRGHNGEGQRAGRSVKRGFEGGQMPLYRRMPKIKGFEQVNKKNWLELTTRSLEALAKREGTALSLEKLTELGLFKPRRMYGVRLIGNAPMTQAVQLEVHYATASAKAALEKAGGKLTLKETSVPNNAA
jgi:large subunit ribosomal protein L15